jgi:hypothetical protein
VYTYWRVKQQEEIPNCSIQSTIKPYNSIKLLIAFFLFAFFIAGGCQRPIDDRFDVVIFPEEFNIRALRLVNAPNSARKLQRLTRDLYGVEGEAKVFRLTQLLLAFFAPHLELQWCVLGS